MKENDRTDQTYYGDVQLDMDDKTMVQPDVIVVCDRDKITKSGIKGAPDLVVEVVSPSNFFVDLSIKFAKYKRAGVREYWLVIPESKTVITYFFDEDDIPEEHTFEDIIPVSIWDGKCTVDFKKIYSEIEFLY